MDSFPKFRAGSDVWTVACDGRVLLVRGVASKAGSGLEQSIDSLIPINAISSLRISRSAADGADVKLRVWDGDEFLVGVDHAKSSETIRGLLSLEALVATINLSWPLSSSRALAARRAIAPGYLRDKFLLGPQGIEEFWSPLAVLPWEFANSWREAGLATHWPIAAVEGALDGRPILVGLTADRLVLINQEGEAVEIAYENMKLPEVFTLDDLAPIHASLGTPPRIRLRVEEKSGVSSSVEMADGAQLQPIFRFLLLRWAERFVEAAMSPIDALQEGSRLLDEGELASHAFAVLVDAVIAAESGVAVSLAFPPQERDYLRPPNKVAASKPTAPATPQPPVGQRVTPSRGAPSARQVAAGAAAGAAIWSLFAD